MILGRINALTGEESWAIGIDPMSPEERTEMVVRILKATSCEKEDWEACDVCGLDSRHEDCTEVEVLQ
jgi:hypothetical protein